MKLLLAQGGLHRRRHARSKHRQMGKSSAEHHTAAGAQSAQAEKNSGRKGKRRGDRGHVGSGTN